MGEFERQLRQYQAKETLGKTEVGSRAALYPHLLEHLYESMERCFAALRELPEGIQRFDKDVVITIGKHSQTASLPYLKLNAGSVQVTIGPDQKLGETLIVRVAGENAKSHFNVVKDENDPQWSIQKPGSQKQWYSDHVFDNLLADAMFN
ncbi:hypothetical protein [Pseudomonas sp. Sample_16]|uniref:hypothetical protein n=1 Tax=Pseudomonas sp. Sample_16 TaxID=2448263 RepID=UPI001032E3BE|nr:hypothetical protein [Pseudomonas sp. Sample_16]